MSDKQFMPHLLDEPPMLVYPSLAVKLKSVNLAIILQQLHFLMNAAKNSKNRYVFIDDRWWVYNSYTEWQKQHFQWLAVPTLKKLFNALESMGLVISRQGVKDKLDRRKWYTIDYAAYLQYVQCMGQKISHDDGIKNIPSNGQKMSHVNKESETPFSETPTEIKDSAPNGAGASKPSKRKPSENPEQAKAIASLIEAWLTHSGTIQPTAYSNKTMRIEAAAMLDEDITPAHIEAYIKTLRLQDFWKDKAITWRKLAGEIKNFVHAHPVIVPEKTPEPVQERATPETVISPEEQAAARALFEQLVQSKVANDGY